MATVELLKPFNMDSPVFATWRIWFDSWDVLPDSKIVTAEYVRLSDVLLTIDGLSIPWQAGMLSGSDTTEALQQFLEASDTIHGSSADDVINAHLGDDTVFGRSGSDTLRGEGGNDTLVGNDSGPDPAVDLLDGGPGDDALYADSNDVVQGAAGRDVLYIVSADSAHIDLAAAGIEWVQTDLGDDSIDGASQGVGIEVYSVGGNDIIRGSGFNDIFWAGSDDDTVIGGAGNDVIVADTGVDSLSGGEGNDILYLDAGDFADGGGGFDAAYITGGVGMAMSMAAANLEWVADFAHGNDSLDGSASSTALEIYAAGGTDIVTGGEGKDFLWGGAGDDIIRGNAGNDSLVGEAGADTLVGGLGIDALFGSSGNGGDGAIDTFLFTDNWGTDFVFDFENGVDKLDVSGVTALESFNDVTVSDTVDGHAYVRFGVHLIAVARNAGQIDAADFVF